MQLRPGHGLDTAPPAVRAAAAEHNLGHTFRVYDAAPARRRGPAWVTIGALVYVAAFTAGLAYLLTIGAGASGLIPLIVLFALLLLFAAIRLVAKAVRAGRSIGAIMPAGSRVYLFDFGLVHSGLTRSGRDRTQAFRWTELSVFRQFHPINSISTTDPAHHTYTVKRPGGATIALDHSYWQVADIQELGGAIVDRVRATQVPRALAAVRAGRGVRFGEFTVNDRGLRYTRSRLARWDRIESVYVMGDELVVRMNRSFFGVDNVARYPAWFIPNDFVLAAVAETLTDQLPA
ncbi:DUF6585 family protein [Flindersiella endophytica]